MYKRPFVIAAAAVLFCAGSAFAQTDWVPPFPAPGADIHCADTTSMDSLDAAVDGLRSKKGKAPDWDDIPVCGKKKAHFDKLSCASVCRATLNDLRPTQRSMGVEAVNCKAHKIEEKLKKKSYDDYFMTGKRLVPVIVGPNEKFYVTDHHHMSNALFRADLSDAKLNDINGADDWEDNPKTREVLVYVLFNLTSDYLQASQGLPQGGKYGMGDFVASMDRYSGGARSPWCKASAEGTKVVLEGVGLNWPCDQQGNPISFQEIAYADNDKERKIWDLEDDPYRSMSRWVRNAYGYVKCKNDDPNVQDFPACTMGDSGNPAFFMEFQWANFMRAHFMREVPVAHRILTGTLPPGHGQLAAISRYLPYGMQVSEGAAAVNMIGFNDLKTEKARPRPFPAFGMAEDECQLVESLEDLGSELGWSD